MEDVKILDCTLRDGAYLLDKQFGESTILGIIQGLKKAKIDIIEIGFFQNEGYGKGKTVYRNSKDAKQYIPKNKEGTLFTVLADYDKYSIENLDMCSADSIDAIRECFKKNERYEALKVCKIIKEKGYKLFIQPVDILGYTDEELLELISLVNDLEPYCFSIVDTFGSMYQEDLCRVFEIINHNLISSCKIGFHSHNNMQLSNALSQEFVRISKRGGNRKIIIDGTISGMGRGAGNTPTELIAQYLNTKWEKNYDIDALLDIIDDYMDNICTKCHWGYSTQYFVAGVYGTHVDNIAYLAQKSSIRSKNMRYILNKIGATARKRAAKELLEKTYLEYMASKIDDTKYIEKLKEKLEKKEILILASGSSITLEQEKIAAFIETKKPIVISVGFLPEHFDVDYVFLSNTRRYSYLQNKSDYKSKSKIITSNIKNQTSEEDEYIISLSRIIKSGWEHLDNSTILLLRLLNYLQVKSITLAGFDGYSCTNENFASEEIELLNVREEFNSINEDIIKMLRDFIKTKNQKIKVAFLTKSKFEDCIQEN